jgi:hypothetical protein
VAVSQAAVAVGTTATALLTVADTVGFSDPAQTSRTVVIQNPSGGTVTIHVGGPGVTASDGLALAPGETLTLDLSPSDKPHAVASAAVTVRVLHLGV